MATEIVTYQYPPAVAGGTTAPTAAQVANLSLVTAQVSLVDTSTSVVITHNFGLSLAQGSNQFPIAWAVCQTPGTAIPAISIALTNSIAITLSKLSAAGAGGTWVVYIMRPNTVIG